MKHMRCISQGNPVRGNAFHEFICAFAVAMNAIISATGGTSPIFQYIDEKCDLPTPNRTS